MGETKLSELELKIIPFFGLIPCGFPSPASDYLDNTLNLHDLVVTKPSATYFMKASGDSMIGDGIYPDDVLVIDRSVAARSGHIVVASIGGEFLLKRLQSNGGQIYLVSSNPKYKPLLITNPDDLQIFGVLTYNLHKHF